MKRSRRFRPAYGVLPGWCAVRGGGLPAAVCMLALAAAPAGCGKRSAKANAGRETVRPVNVVTAPPRRLVFEDRYRCKANVAAVRHANVAARTPGVIDDLFVDRGDHVRQGQNLFQTDRVSLENTVEIRRHETAVARAGVQEAEAGVAKARAAFEKARTDRERFRRLYVDHKAVTKDQFEKVDTAYKQAQAGVDYARALVELAKARLAQSENALKIAQKQLSDSLVKAPFDGVVTRKFQEQGEFAAAGMPVVRIESLDKLEASGFVTADLYAKVVVGKTPVRLTAAGIDPIEAVVTFKSPVIDPITRTFEVKVRIPPKSGLAPGMMCDLDLILARRPGLGVPDRSLLPLAGRWGLFIVQRNRARRLVVHPGLHTDGFVEIRDPESIRGRQVVIDGQSFLRDGAPVRVAPASSEAARAGGGPPPTPESAAEKTPE